VVPRAADGTDRDVLAHGAERGDEDDEQDDEIDLDQLTALLTERLGHLSLPPRPE
jgi:hypothetical protein